MLTWKNTGGNEQCSYCLAETASLVCSQTGSCNQTSKEYNESASNKVFALLNRPTELGPGFNVGELVHRFNSKRHSSLANSILVLPIFVISKNTTMRRVRETIDACYFTTITRKFFHYHSRNLLLYAGSHRASHSSQPYSNTSTDTLQRSDHSRKALWVFGGSMASQTSFARLTAELTTPLYLSCRIEHMQQHEPPQTSTWELDFTCPASPLHAFPCSVQVCIFETTRLLCGCQQLLPALVKQCEMCPSNLEQARPLTRCRKNDVPAVKLRLEKDHTRLQVSASYCISFLDCQSSSDVLETFLDAALMGHRCACPAKLRALDAQTSHVMPVTPRDGLS